MLQRLLLKGSCLLTGKNACIFANGTNSQVQLIWNHAFSQSLGVKSALSPTSVIPLSLECAIHLKILTRTIVKNSLKKTCTFSRYRYKKLTQVWCSQSLACCRSTRYFSRQNVIRAFQRLFRSNLKETKCFAKVALGSALFVPSTLFKDSPQVNDDLRTLPIEIPKETKLPKKEKPFVQLLLNIYDFMQLFLRGLRLFLTFTPILTLYPVTYLGERPADLWWALLLRAIEFSGPIVIKLGQWASTRRDLFPDTCCRQFSRLQRRIKPHSWSFTKYRMRKAFGPNWRKVFIKFDNNRNPVGSGCVAQVYKVWMAKTSVLDEEILGEIISDLDDENNNPLEGRDDSPLAGFEIEGFRSLLGFDDEEKTPGQALAEWRQEREARRLKQESEEKAKLLGEESEADSSSGMELDVSAVTESLASDIVSGEGFQPLNTNTEEAEGENNLDTELEVTEHSLVEVWGEGDLDKSLPVEEGPPDDMEDLIPVAVKVLHPAMYTYFRRDLRILRACASFITTIYPPLRWLSLPQCVDEFAEVMSGQINLRKEAENLEFFSENFADVTSVKFPRPLRPFVTRKVIVETYEEGESMGDFTGSSGEDIPNDLKVNIARIGVDALLKMIFVDNLVHGDMHPGNMLIQNININEDGVNEKSTGDVTRIMMVDVGCDTFVMDVQPDPNPLRICLLDCGVVARLKEVDLANFKAVFKQIVLGDGESVADLFLENSEHSCKDPDAFKTEMTQLVENAREDTISLAQVDVGVLLQEVLGILLKHQVRLESAFSAVVLAVFVLEGLGRTLDPNMDILERARPMLVRGN